MKKELRTLIGIEIFLGICMMIGLFIARPIIEKDGTVTFWYCFWTILPTLIVVFSTNTYLYYRKLKKQGNLPTVDERTVNNMRTAIEWSCFFILTISSILIFGLLYLEVDQTQTT